MEASQITPPQGPQVGDKGLKKDAIGLRLQRRHRRGVDRAGLHAGRDARLHRRGDAGIGLQAPAVLLVSFVPMLLVAAAYYYMNRADPDCGTTFAWVTRRMGPYARLARRLGDHRRRHHRDGQPRADRGAVLVPAVRLGLGGRLDAARSRRVGVVWIAIMTAICVDRHRAVGAHAARAARRRGRHARRCSRSSRSSRSTPATPGRLASTRASSGSTRSRSTRFDALVVGRAARRLHLLGLGQHASPSTRRREDSDEGPGKAAITGDGDPAR